MFLVDDATIRAIHAAYERSDDLAAIIELRERFPGLTNNAGALDAVRMILTMRPDDGAIAARLAALKTRKRGSRPGRANELVIW